MSENSGVEACSFCDSPVGVFDRNSLIYSKTICCGDCTHRMGLDGGMILNCGLCQFPVLDTPSMIEDHDYEYCQSCYDFLIKAGFQSYTAFWGR